MPRPFFDRSFRADSGSYLYRNRLVERRRNSLLYSESHELRVQIMSLSLETQNLSSQLTIFCRRPVKLLLNAPYLLPQVMILGLEDLLLAYGHFLLL